MKLSEWIEEMQRDLEKGGDRDVVLHTGAQLYPNCTYDVLPHPSFIPEDERRFVIYPASRKY